MDIPADLLAALRSRAQTLACAESLTGGGLADALSGVPGASAVFRGGVVSYATEVKRRLLGVRAPRVISAECAEQMAAGVRELLDATWGLSTTGVAGPDRQEDQPVGTVYVAVSGPSSVVRRLDLQGDRAEIRAGAVAGAMTLLAQVLDG